MSEINDAIDDFGKLFNILDKNHDGIIEDDVLRLLPKLFSSAEEDQNPEVTALFNNNEIIQLQKLKSTIIDEIKKLVTALDHNGDGVIDDEDIILILKDISAVGIDLREAGKKAVKADD